MGQAPWLLLSLALLVPLTGLALSFGITFPGTTPCQPAERLPVADTVRLLASEPGIAELTPLGPCGGRLIARIHHVQACSSSQRTGQGHCMKATGTPSSAPP
jgi:hypothetical protein